MSVRVLKLIKLILRFGGKAKEAQIRDVTPVFHISAMVVQIHIVSRDLEWKQTRCLAREANNCTLMFKM